MNILQLIASSSYITLNKNLIKIFGLEGAAIIGTFASVHNYNELICEKKGIEFDGWFYKTYEDIEEELGLSKHISSKAINSLIKNKILIDKKKGVPCLRYFKFQEVEIFNSLKLKNLTTRSQKNESQEVKKINDLSGISFTSSNQNTLSQVGEIFNCNNKTDKNTNKNISIINKEDEIILFFETFWKRWEASSDSNKGSKSEAEKQFNKLISDKKNPINPVHLIIAEDAYLKNCQKNNIKTCHVSTFLSQKRHDEFIEAEIAKIETIQKYQHEVQSKEAKIKTFNDDQFWIKAKESLICSKIPDNWKKYIETMVYFGTDAQSCHLIGVSSKFIRDWFKREFKAVFDEIFGKWILISKE